MTAVLDEAEVDAVFPFHCVVDERMRLQGLGPALARVLGNVAGQPLVTHFLVQRPTCDLTLEALSRRTGKAFVLKSTKNGMSLKGQVLVRRGEALFLMSPWITDVRELDPLGLAWGDFPAHDRAADYLFLLQSRTTALDDVRRLSDQLTRKNSALEEALHAKSEFLASMTHELRTPLNAIIGYTVLTLDRMSEKLDDPHLANLRKAERAARKLLALITDILDFSRIEAGALESRLEDVDLRDVLDDCALTARGLLAERSLGFVEEAPSELPRLRTDPTMLNRILDNLLSNAVKATTEGTIRLRVEVRDADVRIDIVDPGEGIPAEKIETIFEAFKQLDGTSRKRFQGTGLGLAIVRSLCDHLGIGISVRSEVGRGSTFSITVPRGAPIACQIPERELGVVELLLEPDARARATVVVAGGEETVEAVRASLRQQPLDVVAALSPEAVTRATAEAPIWAVVLEPDALGVESLRALRKAGGAEEVPTLLCRAGVPPQRVDWLAKPIEAVALLEALARITRRRAPTARRQLVLVVEDDDDIADLYEMVLADAGYEAKRAQDGGDALEQLRAMATPPDVIILDLLMPNVDGFAVLRELRRVSAWRRIPVIVATGRDLTDIERQQVLEGAQLLFEKGRTDPGAIAGEVDALLRAIEARALSSVLVVDDHAMNLDLVSEIFASASYDVIPADGGRRALALAIDRQPDVVVTDLAMPGMDGFELTRALRSDPRTAETVVAACTAFALDEMRERARSAGCDGFITKPVEPRQLVHQVQRIALAAKVQRFARRWAQDRGTT
jgi:signal transduction histidine kinase/CheY-like chemotaxis protein